MSILPKEFYGRSTITVAKELLGKRLVRKMGRHTASATITETEAYCHLNDPASHAFGGMTPRNRAMFGQVGMAYVYFTYGMHHCFNVVAKNPHQKAGAVLVRAATPEKGADIMLQNRKNAKDIGGGPAKLAQALCITKEQYGADLTSRGALYIEDGSKPDRIVAGPRIGISRATEKMWNFKSA